MPKFPTLAAVTALALSLPLEAARAQARPPATMERECFTEGAGARHCVELTLGCAAHDAICLMDDLSGAILRAQGNAELKYAAYLARGEVARRTKRLSDALADFEAAQALQPRLATPHILISRALAEAGQTRRAIASLDEADRRAPGLPMILLQRAALRETAGDPAGAVADLTRAIDIMRSGRPLPDGAEEPLETLLVARARVHLAAGAGDKASADALAVLAAVPGHADAQALLEAVRAR